MRILPEKISIRLFFLLSILFVSVLGLVKIYYEENKPGQTLISSPTPTQRPISTPNPTSLPTPTPIIRSFSSGRQNISVTIPKYLDGSSEKETYEISFDKVSTGSRYYLSNGPFSPLTIFDKNYEFSIRLDLEILGDDEELEKTFTEVNTNQFGTLKKIIEKTGPGNELTYKYFTNYFAVDIFPGQKEMYQGAFMSCRITGEDRGECDKLISTLSIKLK